jgi:predicted ABC-type transport system involved in lysophospholipase L1 biosynthesis ATPase subunit
VALSGASFVAFRAGWRIALVWLLLAGLVAAAARYRPRRDGGRPDAADLLAVGGWALAFALAPTLIAADHGGWLAPALLLYAAQRAARSPIAVSPDEAGLGPPSRAVRGTLGLDRVVVSGADGLPRSLPIELDLLAGDSLAILCDAPAEAALLAEVLAGRRPPLSGRVTVDGAALAPGDRLVAVVGPGEPFVAGDLDRNLGTLADGPLPRATVSAVREACALAEVAAVLGEAAIGADGEPLAAFHRLLVAVARVIPSSFRLLVVVDPMPWLNAVRGEVWRAAVVRASVGRTAVWITPDRELARRATRRMEYRQGALRPVDDD